MKKSIDSTEFNLKLKDTLTKIIEKKPENLSDYFGDLNLNRSFEIYANIIEPTTGKVTLNNLRLLLVIGAISNFTNKKYI